VDIVRWMRRIACARRNMRYDVWTGSFAIDTVTGNNDMSLPIIEMTRDRLWFLYCLCDFSYRQIAEELTMWSYDEVKNGIRKWSLDRLHDPSLMTRELVNEAIVEIAPKLRGLANLTAPERESAVMEAIQRFVADNGMTWHDIDATANFPSLRERLRDLIGAALRHRKTASTTANPK